MSRDELTVCESFPAIQGEGKTIGKPVQFLRLSYCNVACPWCFGIMPSKYRLPRVYKTIDDLKIITKFSGTPLNQIKEGDKIFTYDDDMNLVETTVKKVLKSKRDVIKVRVGIYNYIVTPEHPFFTSTGIKKAEELEVGDLVKRLQPSDVWKLNRYTKFGNLVYDEIDKIRNNDNSITNIFTPMYEKLKELLQNDYDIKNFGDNNGNSSGFNNFTFLHYLIEKKYITTCSISGKHDCKLIVHHIDKDTTNNNFNNLIVVSNEIHNNIHQRGFNFNKEQKNEVFYEVQNIDKNIAHKDCDVINLSCEPYNTYLVDNMWVHNCDTKYYNEGTVKSVDEVIRDLDKSGMKDIVITGGEPMLQKEGVFRLMGKADSYRYHLETNGTIYDYRMKFFDTIACSPKRFGKPVPRDVSLKLAELDNITYKFVYEPGLEPWWEGYMMENEIKRENVYMMPLGATRLDQEKNMPEVIEYSIKNKFNFSPRIQVLVYDTKRGV